MRVLVLGVTSNIGYKFYVQHSNKFEIYGSYRNLPPTIPKTKRLIRLSSPSRNQLLKIINKVKPDVVVNCIAQGNVDQCEQNYESCNRLNFGIVVDLVNILKKSNVKLVHFSSNAIYDGENPLYNEVSKAFPVNNYGKIKLKADKLILKLMKNYLLLRPITMIGHAEKFQRDNPATFIIKKLHKNQNLKLVNDDFVNFLYLDDMSKILGTLLQKKINGEFNISGNEILNRYQLGLKILKKIQTKSLIIECTSKAFNQYARRAHNTSFDNSKIRKLLKFKFTPVEIAIENIIKKT